jgi:DNA-binding NtrC family response regulator
MYCLFEYLHSFRAARNEGKSFMPASVHNGSHIALIDDDVHSARLFVRTLSEQGVWLTKWLGDAIRGERLLTQQFEDDRYNWPSLVIVDLRAHSTATLEFVARIAPMAEASGSMVVAVMPTINKSVRDALHAAGAAAVFERHAELTSYRQEAASIISFWARNQRLDAVGM